MNLIHHLRLIISRGTIDAVVRVVNRQTSIVLGDVRRQILMSLISTVAIGQHLSEVEIVIRPDG